MVLARRQAEPRPKVDNWNHFAPQVDHAPHLRRHVGHPCDGTESNDLPHLEHGNPVRLAAKRDRQILAGTGGLPGLIRRDKRVAGLRHVCPA